MVIYNIKIQCIERAKSRKVARLRKRSNELLKKLNEITDLYGADACTIIYMPGKVEPLIWPSTRQGDQKVIEKFCTSLPNNDACEKMTIDTDRSKRMTEIRNQMLKIIADNRRVFDEILKAEDYRCFYLFMKEKTMEMKMKAFEGKCSKNVE